MTDWKSAKCAGMDSGQFQGLDVGNGGRALAFAAKARELCAGCPVLAQCASEALEMGDTGCIRGGVAISDTQTNWVRDRLEFAVVNGYTAATAHQVNEFMKDRPPRARRRPQVPNVYTMLTPQQTEWNVLAMTKRAFSVEQIAMQLDMHASTVGRIRNLWIERGRLSKAEILALSPDHPGRRGRR